MSSACRIFYRVLAWLAAARGKRLCAFHHRTRWRVVPRDLSSDAPGVAACVGDEIRGWKFPAHGCSQKTMAPVHFVRAGGDTP